MDENNSQPWSHSLHFSFLDPLSYVGERGSLAIHVLVLLLARGQAVVYGLCQGRAELPTHGAVHAEVDGAVDEREDVDDVAEGHVDVPEEVLDGHAQDDEHALRHLGEDVHDDDGEQHHGGAAVLVVAGSVIALQPPSPLVRLPQRPEEQAPEEGYEEDGDDLAGDGVDEEGDDGHLVRLVLADGHVQHPELRLVGRPGPRPHVRDDVVGDHQERRAAKRAEDEQDGGSAVDRPERTQQTL